MEKRKNKLTEIFTKLKGIKHIEIIIGIIGVALMILIFSSSFFKGKDKSKSTAVIQSESTAASQMEKRLAEVIAAIDGVGQAQVMITYKSTSEKITAKTTTTNVNNSTSNGGSASTSTSITETPVIVSANGKSEPYVLKEIMPEVVGVVVVAKGAERPVTRLAIMRAVQTALNVSALHIEIFPMN